MDPHDSTPIFMDLRERMVRIETKLDNQAERNDTTVANLAAHDSRLTQLEAEAAQARGSIKALKWAGGVGGAVLTVFSDRLLHLFH